MCNVIKFMTNRLMYSGRSLSLTFILKLESLLTFLVLASYFSNWKKRKTLFFQNSGLDGELCILLQVFVLKVVAFQN